MSYFLLDDYKNMEPYVPGEQPQGFYLKLNANESSLPPSPRVLEALNIASINNIGQYSDPHCLKLRQAIGKAYGFGANQVFVGNGADEVLGFCMMSFFRKGMKICFPDITYDFYRTYAKTYQLDYQQFPLNEDFTINVEDYIHCQGDVILANPNNPTGLSMSIEDIERIVQKDPERMVIIDEAYVDYGNASCLSLVNKYPNLLVVQTFSKSRNMAGARIGFAISSPAIIEDMNKIKFTFNPFNMSSFALEAGIAAVGDVDYWQRCLKEVIATRKLFEDDCEKLGFHVIRSTTNFTFMTHSLVPAREIVDSLKHQHILIRHYEDERISDYIRITIGTRKQMVEVLHALHGILEAHHACAH